MPVSAGHCRPPLHQVVAVQVHVADKGCFCIRANTLTAFAEANRCTSPCSCKPCASLGCARDIDRASSHY